MPLQVLVAGSMHIIVHSISISQYQCIHFTIAVFLFFTRPPHRRSVMRKRVPSSTQCCKWQASEEVRTHDLHSSTTNTLYIPVHPLGSSSSWVLVSALWTIYWSALHHWTVKHHLSNGVDRSICRMPLELLVTVTCPLHTSITCPPPPSLPSSLPLVDTCYCIALCHYMMRQYASALKYISEIIERGIKDHPGQCWYTFLQAYLSSQKCFNWSQSCVEHLDGDSSCNCLFDSSLNVHPNDQAGNWSCPECTHTMYIRVSCKYTMITWDIFIVCSTDCMQSWVWGCRQRAWISGVLATHRLVKTTPSCSSPPTCASWFFFMGLLKKNVLISSFSQENS